MKILFDLTHPADVHVFKHLMRELADRKHDILVVARDKDLTVPLLKAYGQTCQVLSRQKKGIGLVFEMFEHQWKLYRLAKKWRPDWMIGFVGTLVAPVGRLLNIPTVGVNDTEHARLTNMVTFPWLHYLLTPSCFTLDVGPKQTRFDSYKELAYLHPNRFSPNINVVRKLGLSETEPFFVLRFVSWAAAHDVGEKGFSESGKREIIQALSKRGRVLLTSEAPLPEDLEPYRLQVSPIDIHDLLAFATLYIGEGGTMASEAAVLGTPSIYVNSLRMGYLNELEEKYGLTFSFNHEQQALKKAIELVDTPNLKQEWAKKREHLLREKVDLTLWMLQWIEKHGLIHP